MKGVRGYFFVTVAAVVLAKNPVRVTGLYSLVQHWLSFSI
jgi:hypothetical protein